jgi:hypothetical protein
MNGDEVTKWTHFMERAYDALQARPSSQSHLGRGNERKPVRTGAQKRDPTHSTLHLFLDHISQNIPVDVEDRGTMDRGIGFGFSLAIGLLRCPVPFDSGRLGMVHRGHVRGEGELRLGKCGLGCFQ